MSEHAQGLNCEECQLWCSQCTELQAGLRSTWGALHPPQQNAAIAALAAAQSLQQALLALQAAMLAEQGELPPFLQSMH
eukprot:CAMPEP_0119326384 /NCGR_PEP_ID=MMETSP1333-20130426/68231_1 /TAXON_ID=418940 /ORGANISM="Scyphosphaera apsteinii, Strain RCC1455" /LENGTH=78 /DNA_ID=CAMNT_0007334677 /DNA_START=22 /DNA_END=258 /DNA_ORIENTATION=+